MRTAASEELASMCPYCNIILHAIAMAHEAIASARGWCINGRITRVRLTAELERAQSEIAQIREENRIKDARMAQIEPHKRPHYPPVERMAILELRAVWSVNRSADVFLVKPATISDWMRRLDEKGPEALVQLREPVNKFPEFVAYLVQRLRTLCPTLVVVDQGANDETRHGGADRWPDRNGALKGRSHRSAHARPDRGCDRYRRPDRTAGIRRVRSAFNRAAHGQESENGGASECACWETRALQGGARDDSASEVEPSYSSAWECGRE